MNMWQEGSVLPVESVQFRKNLEGQMMVHGTCPILVEGNEYIFRCPAPASAPAPISYFPRVKAVNKSSKGHWNYSIPSEPSDSMIAKIRFSEWNVLTYHP